MNRFGLLVLLALACAALAQDQNGEVEMVIMSKAQFNALELRMAWLKAQLEKRERADREAKAMLGCT